MSSDAANIGDVDWASAAWLKVSPFHIKTRLTCINRAPVKNTYRLTADAHFFHDPMAVTIAMLDGLHHAILVMRLMHVVHVVHRHVVSACGYSRGQSCSQSQGGSENDIAHFKPHLEFTTL
jgi:hypothetical protein